MPAGQAYATTMYLARSATKLFLAGMTAPARRKSHHVQVQLVSVTVASQTVLGSASCKVYMCTKPVLDNEK